MSISAFISVSATAAPGLAPIRRYDAHQARNAGSFATDGARSASGQRDARGDGHGSHLTAAHTDTPPGAVDHRGTHTSPARA